MVAILDEVDQAQDEFYEVYGAELDVGFLNRCAVLAELCSGAYNQKKSDVGKVTEIDLPIAKYAKYSTFSLLNLQLQKLASARERKVKAKLLYFREAEQNGEQQYGVWRVSGYIPEDQFLVVAFRGTANTEDIWRDLDFYNPVPLSKDSSSGLKVHQGFYEGVIPHADNIVKILEQQDKKNGRRLPVWVTGHSMGGAYANALILHLLDSKRTHHLFSKGGGSCTYGAPMIVHSESQEEAYRGLAVLEDDLDLEENCSLSFHNFVNNADLVPRMLGGSLLYPDSPLHCFAKYLSKLPISSPTFSFLMDLVQSLAGVAAQYHPFGQYHLVVGTDVRSFAMPKTTSGACSRLGNAEYGRMLIKEMRLLKLYKTKQALMVHLSKFTRGGWTAHNMPSYKERVNRYRRFLFANVERGQSIAALSLFSSRTLRLEEAIYIALKRRAHLRIVIKKTAGALATAVSAGKNKVKLAAKKSKHGAGEETEEISVQTAVAVVVGVAAVSAVQAEAAVQEELAIAAAETGVVDNNMLPAANTLQGIAYYDSICSQADGQYPMSQEPMQPQTPAQHAQEPWRVELCNQAFMPDHAHPQAGPPYFENGLLGHEQVIYRKLEKVVYENYLHTFYPPERLYDLAKSIATKDLERMLPWGLPPEIALDLTALALYDICILIDDRGSAAWESSCDAIEELKVVMGIAAQAITAFDPDGLFIRFVNSSQEGMYIQNAADVSNLLHGVRNEKSGMAPLGTALETKVVNPFVLRKEECVDPKPVLVLYAIDGDPVGEDVDYLRDVIVNTKRQLEESPYGPGAVAFQMFPFAQESNATHHQGGYPFEAMGGLGGYDCGEEVCWQDRGARRFLSYLAEDVDLACMLTCTLSYWEEYKEYQRQYIELDSATYTVKLMLGAIDCSYEEDI